jgi:ferrous iron transport protein B
MDNIPNKDKSEDILSLANSLRWDLGVNFHDTVIESIYADASKIAGKTVKVEGEGEAYGLDLKIDRIVTSRWLGFPYHVFTAGRCLLDYDCGG